MQERSKSGNNTPAELLLHKVSLRERIEKRAYHLWLTSGGGHGMHLAHWLQAEGEVLKAIQAEQERRTSSRQPKSAAKQRSAPASYDLVQNQ